MRETKKGGKRRSGETQMGREADGAQLGELRRRIGAGQGPPLTASQLARLCYVEARVVHSWAAKGALRCFRTPGQHLRFQVSDVAAFLQQQAPATRPVDTLVLCNAVRRRLVRRNIVNRPVSWFNEPLSLLVEAARSQPSVVIIDPIALLPLEPEAFLGALNKASPRADVVWLGDGSQKVAEPVGALVR